MREHKKYATILSVFAAVLYLALLVAAFGLISLATDRDVIADPAAGPLVGPSMVGAAVVVVFAMMLVLGANSADERHINVGYAFASGLAAFGIFIATGALLFAAGDGVPFHVVTFSASMLLSPFALATGLLAVVVVIAYSALLASRVGDNGRPLWPWERRGE